MCLKQHACQVRALGALIGYQPRVVSERRNCNHLVHRCAASWAVSPVVSANSASVQHDTRPLRWGSMSHIPPTEVTRYAKVGCRWGAKQSYPRWSTVRSLSPSHPAQHVANRHGLPPTASRCGDPASIEGLSDGTQRRSARPLHLTDDWKMTCTALKFPHNDNPVVTSAAKRIVRTMPSPNAAANRK